MTGGHKECVKTWGITLIFPNTHTHSSTDTVIGHDMCFSQVFCPEPGYRSMYCYYYQLTKGTQQGELQDTHAHTHLHANMHKLSLSNTYTQEFSSEPFRGCSTQSFVIELFLFRGKTMTAFNWTRWNTHTNTLKQRSHTPPTEQLKG